MIPRIIHQIWSDIHRPLPSYFELLTRTWKHDYPDWEYILWNDSMMDKFIQKNYPQYCSKYYSFKHNVQRWDSIRYLILDKIGGMYVDIDYESIKPLDKLLEGKKCCFSQEPPLHRGFAGFFNNALMASEENNIFMGRIISNVFYYPNDKEFASKDQEVFHTTGPKILNQVYDDLSITEKEDIYLIPHDYVSPFDLHQAAQVRQGVLRQELENRIFNSYAVHHYFGTWNS